ncbi:hypothetical protein SAMN05421780_10548 [Flexibacter flexilis DSM 6793]|uniref:Uncharacterized protein n=1 Tax=Flexibacter flexilis DSM 6793 TaxID=927664 RepID=A0A1I1IQN1_9BACT|nr:hypothetical protein SAMN05421780_10548 [Flexibacter flexilis DSM 6793]
MTIPKANYVVDAQGEKMSYQSAKKLDATKSII